MDEPDYDTTIAFLVGAVLLFVLLFLMGVLGFYTWLVVKLISYCASVFFIVPVAWSIIRRQLPREYVVLMVFGVGSLIVYALLFNMTVHDIVVDVVQTAVIITIFSGFFSIIKRFVEKKVPP